MDSYDSLHAERLDGDKRGEARETVCWHGEMMAGAQCGACTVLDISPYGVRLMTALPLAIELPVVLNLGPKGVFGGEVRWHDGGLVGVKFTAGLKAEDRIAGGDRSEPGAKVYEWRREPRREIARRAELTSGARNSPCRVLDLSPSGARVLAAQPLAPDSAATLSLGPQHSLRGQVVWAIGEICGLRFDQPDERLRQLVTAAAT